MFLVKINTPVHYHVKKNRICKNKICQGPVSFFDGNMVVSAGMAHIQIFFKLLLLIIIIISLGEILLSYIANTSCMQALGLRRYITYSMNRKLTVFDESRCSEPNTTIHLKKKKKKIFFFFFFSESYSVQNIYSDASL